MSGKGGGLPDIGDHDGGHGEGRVGQPGLVGGQIAPVEQEVQKAVVVIVDEAPHLGGHHRGDCPGDQDGGPDQPPAPEATVDHQGHGEAQQHLAGCGDGHEEEGVSQGVAGDGVSPQLAVVFQIDEWLAQSGQAEDDPVQAEIEGMDDGIEGEDGDKGETGEKERRREEPLPAPPRGEAMDASCGNRHGDIMPPQGARVNNCSISAATAKDSRLMSAAAPESARLKYRCITFDRAG